MLDISTQAERLTNGIRYGLKHEAADARLVLAGLVQEHRDTQRGALQAVGGWVIGLCYAASAAVPGDELTERGMVSGESMQADTRRRLCFSASGEEGTDSENAAAIVGALMVFGPTPLSSLRRLIADESRPATEDDVRAAVASVRDLVHKNGASVYAIDDRDVRQAMASPITGSRTNMIR